MGRQGSIEPVLAIIAGGSGGYLAAVFFIQLLSHALGAPASQAASGLFLAIGGIMGACWSARNLGR